MRKIRRILVAVKDPQGGSLPAVAKAAQLARAFGAKLEIFHAIDTHLYIDTAGPETEGFRGLAREVRAKRLAQLESIASRVRRHGTTVSTAAEWDFPAYEAILRRASRTGADLIVAGCRTGRRFAPGLLRLTDWELVRHSPVPLLLVKKPRPYRHPVLLAAIDPSHAHAKSSKLDEEILKSSSALQQAMRGTLHAVHAYFSMPFDGASVEALDPVLIKQMRQDATSSARKRFDRALRRINIPRARGHLIARHPQDAIQAVARETRSAIVVMGAVSRSGLKRLFIGNTAESLLDDLDCDVLVVKSPHFASGVPRAPRGLRLIAPEPMTPLTPF